MATLTSGYIHHAPVSMDKVNRVAVVRRWTYGLVPVIAGADKFMHVLTDWNKYLAPVVTDILPLSPDLFMSIVGVVEIIAGILVFAKPRLGSFIVGLWLVGIAINLLIAGYLDIAVRDIVMAIGAFSLYTLIGEPHAGEK